MYKDLNHKYGSKNMKSNEMSVLVVATPLPSTGGGGYRALLAMKEYKKRKINTSFILPWGALFHLQHNVHHDNKVIFELKQELTLAGISKIPVISNLNFLGRGTLSRLVVSCFPYIVKMIINDKSVGEPDCVISMHEGFDAITTAYLLGEQFSLKKVALLQLPPFYGLKNRINNIEEALLMWYKMIIPNKLWRRTLFILKKNVDKVISKKIAKMLKDFNLILAVSKSIPIEMGEFWKRKVISLDPGVAFTQEDLALMDIISKKVLGKKQNLVIFGGRPSAEKGIIEAFMVWRNILKRVGRSYQLVVTGEVPSSTLEKLKNFCHRIGIENNVLFTGYLSREERLTVCAKSKMMLYPSHIDAFPYAVLEALHLNTPVVAYDIPALESYYKNFPGVTLVKESDIEQFTQKSIEIIESKKIYIERPRFIRSWDEIMNEEVNLIKKFVLN
jgi:glycosyltransferase involved in cell wall biosynthesis